MIRRPPSLSSALGRPPMRVLLPPAWMTPVTLTRHTFTAPWRRTRGGSTVVSRTVEGSPPAVGPPSSTRSIASRKYASTADAVVGGSSPFGLALGAVTGAPRALTRPRAGAHLHDGLGHRDRVHEQQHWFGFGSRLELED